MNSGTEIVSPAFEKAAGASNDSARAVADSHPRISKLVWPAAFLVLLTFLVYQPVWRAGFLWDDDVLLTGNRAVHAADGLRAIWSGAESPDYFPVTSTVLWLQWRLWGANPLGYHLVNVLLHALSAVIFWRVLSRLSFPGAWLAAAIFALHPVNVESVAWISELKNTLAMVFFSLTLLAYLRFEETDAQYPDLPERGSATRSNVDEQRGETVQTHNSSTRCCGSQSRAPMTRSWIWYGVALGAFVLALLSKTAVAPLPLVLVGLAWWRRGRVSLRDLTRCLPFFLAAAALAVVTIWFQQHHAIGSIVVRDDSFASRLAGAGRAIWFYLYKIILPLNLSFVYPRWQIQSANPLSYLPGLMAVAAVLVGWRFRARWGRAWWFAFAYFALMLAPVLGFLDISFMRYSLVADRWQYFAMLGPVALLAAAIASRASLPGGRHSLTLISAALLLTLGALSWQRAGTFSGPETLWTATLKQNPECFVAHAELGNLLVNRGRASDAIPHYEAALKVSPDYELGRYNLGYALLQQGKAAEAIVQLEHAVALQPDYLPAQYHLGDALYQSGRIDDAIVHYRKALTLAPRFAEAHNSLGNALLHHEQLPEAVTEFQKALEIQPDYPNALNNLGVARFQQALWDEARSLFQRAVDLQPDFAEGQNNLGRILFLQGKTREAMTHYRASLRSQPDDPDTLSNLAWVLATSPDAALRNGTEALELARRANQVSRGDNPAALRALAAACAETGRFAEAITVGQRAFKFAQARRDLQEMDALRIQLRNYEAETPFHQ